MTNTKLRVVGSRLEQSVSPHLTEEMTLSDRYELYEQVAIQMLDSEYMDYSEGELEAYLLDYLAALYLRLSEVDIQGD